MSLEKDLFIEKNKGNFQLRGILSKLEVEVLGEIYDHAKINGVSPSENWEFEIENSPALEVNFLDDIKVKFKRDFAELTK